MNQLLRKVLEDLKRFEVTLVMRRKLNARFPPGMMADLAFTFNGHGSLGEHEAYLGAALEEVTQEVVKVLRGELRDPEVLLGLRAVHVEVKVLLVAVESRMELVLHDGVVAGSTRLCGQAAGQWDALCGEVRMFVAQQLNCTRQLLMLMAEIEGMLAAGTWNPPEERGSDVMGPGDLGDFAWRGEEVALLELFLALEETGVLLWRRSEWKRPERLERFASVFGMESKYSRQSIHYLMNRKSGPARFVAQCSQALERLREVRESR